MRSRLLPLTVTLMLGCAACLSSGCASEVDVGLAREDVQSQFRAEGRYRVVTVPADGEDIDALLLGSTAAIVHYGTASEDGVTLDNASCGSTFISPHFAVTAAHCVSGVAAGAWTSAGEFFVDEIDVSAVDPAQIVAKSAVTGTWPDWSTGHSFAPPPGYQRNRLRCRVICGDVNAGFTQCTGGTSMLDLALVECPARDSEYWVYTGNTHAAVGQQVQAFWYHEILDLPTTGSPGQERFDRYQRFQDLDGDGRIRPDNFHYRWAHLLWPLISDTNPSGGPGTVTTVRTTNTSTDQAATQTNLFGCHGTSGSGIFARGSTTFYGPITRGGFGGLCGTGMHTVSVVRTNELQNLPRVVSDRNGVYTPAF